MATNSLELKHGFVHMVQQLVHFHGLPDEHTNDHIGNFLEVRDMLKINKAFDDAIRLCLFLFSLKCQAK